MIKVVIVDDEPLAADLVAEYLEDFPQIEIVARCINGFQGVKGVQEFQPDLLFLDVQMPKISGFEMLELLDEPPTVIFTTAFDEFAIQAFENNAIDYLLKPFSKERFEKAVQKFLTNFDKKAIPKSPFIQNLRPQNPNRIVIKDGHKIRILPLKEITRLEADGDYVKIFSEQGNFLKKKTLTFYEGSLSPEVFVRVHRSHLLNVQQITSIDPYEKNNHIAVLKNGEKIPVSRSGFQKLKEVLSL